MHELSVTKSILDTVLSHAGNHGAKRIIRIRLAIGELHDLNIEWIQRYFDRVAADTIAAGAKIEAGKTPAGFRCHDCSHDFDIDLSTISGIHCPNCGGTNCTLERGREFYIDDMEITV